VQGWDRLVPPHLAGMFLVDGFRNRAISMT
jgi:hypothetical protein